MFLPERKTQKSKLAAVSPTIPKSFHAQIDGAVQSLAHDIASLYYESKTVSHSFTEVNQRYKKRKMENFVSQPLV